MSNEWTMPEDQNAPVTIGEARQLFAMWNALDVGATVPQAASERLTDCSPDFVRLAVEQADRADAAEQFAAPGDFLSAC